jgi:hypothetical protein
MAAAGAAANNDGKELPSLHDLNKETVDLENIPIEEVFAQLRCTKEGLTTDEGNNRLAIFGSNKLEEKVVQSTNSSFLRHFIFCFLCWASRRSFKQIIQDVKISPS